MSNLHFLDAGFSPRVGDVLQSSGVVTVIALHRPRMIVRLLRFLRVWVGMRAGPPFLTLSTFLWIQVVYLIRAPVRVPRSQCGVDRCWKRVWSSMAFSGELVDFIEEGLVGMRESFHSQGDLRVFNGRESCGVGLHHHSFWTDMSRYSSGSIHNRSGNCDWAFPPVSQEG